MAVGDAYQIGPTSTANGSFLDLQPGSGVEVVVHNVYFAGAMELYFYDGTNFILFDADVSAGARYGLQCHVTNTKYVRIKNVSGGAIYLAADGMVTK